MEIISRAIAELKEMEESAYSKKSEINDLVFDYVFRERVFISDVNRYGRNPETGIDYVAISTNDDFKDICDLFSGIVHKDDISVYLSRNRLYFTVPHGFNSPKHFSNVYEVVAFCSLDRSVV